MKSWVLVISLLITNMAMGQTIADGLHLIDRDQPSRAKQVFEGLVTASPTGENYYYLGYYFLKDIDEKYLRNIKIKFGNFILIIVGVFLLP